MFGIHINKGVESSLAVAIKKERKLAAEMGIQLRAAQIFITNPHGYTIEHSEQDLHEIREAAADLLLFVHATYTSVLNGTKRANVIIQKQLDVCNKINAAGFIIHTSSTQPQEMADILRGFRAKTRIYLENRVVKDATVSYNSPADLSRLFAAMPAHIGICIDTCHLYCVGIDLGDLAATRKYLRAIDEWRGDRALMFHLNDCRFGISSFRDVHAPIGTNIWKDTRGGLEYLVEYCGRTDIPMIIEQKRGIIQDYKIMRDLLGGE